MKMRTVIEAGRKASPQINQGMTEIGEKLSSFRQVLSDLCSVKSDSAREAVMNECLRSIDGLSGSLVDTQSIWREFDETLCGYRYRFGRAKKKKVVDLPGQQVLFEEQEACGPSVRSDLT